MLKKKNKKEKTQLFASFLYFILIQTTSSTNARGGRVNSGDKRVSSGESEFRHSINCL